MAKKGKNNQEEQTEKKSFLNLFQKVLIQSEYSLNEYVDGYKLAIPDKFKENINQLLDIVPFAFRDENREEILNQIKGENYYNQINKFVEWLEGYISSEMKPYEDSEFIRKMNPVELEKITAYCFDNFVLQDIGKERIATSDFTEQNIIILRKIIYIYMEMIISENFGKEKSFSEMEIMFGINSEYCNLLWQLIKKNEDKLWKNMLMKKHSSIEQKLDELLEVLED